jgi:hypothetical protein
MAHFLLIKHIGLVELIKSVALCAGFNYFR